ncbi:putative ribonuclease H-like domain-containing protein [Tanacetum coccineum]
MGHFARECRALRNKDDGVGFDWSDMAKEQVQTNMVLMAFSNSEITDKSKKGLGYNAVPPPHHLFYNAPTKLDLSYSGLDEFKEPEFKSYGLRDKQVSENENSSIVSPLNVDKETIFPADKKIEFVKPKSNEKPVKKSLKSFDHVHINCHHHQKKRMMSGNNYNRVDYDYYAKTSHPSAHRNMVPRAVLLKSGLTPLNTARPVYTAQPKPTVHSARSMSHFSKQAQLTNQRPFYKKTTLTNRYFHQKVNTVMGHCYTVRPKAVNTARPYTTPVNAVRTKKVNAVKTSACWVWRPTRPNGVGTTMVVGISGKGTLKLIALDFGRHRSIRTVKYSVARTSSADGVAERGKFDGKSDEGFFVGYSLSSKDFRVYNTRTRKKDASYFDSLSKDVGNDEPKSAADDIRQVEDGPHNESDDKDNPEVNTGHFEFNILDPLVNTTSSYDPHSLKDMLKVGVSHTLEATHVEFFNDEDELEVNLGNIPNSYTPPGFRDPEHPDYVCLLQRSLYGLKQAPRAWFQRFAALHSLTDGLLLVVVNPSLFIYRHGDYYSASLHREIFMKDLGALNYFWGFSYAVSLLGDWWYFRLVDPTFYRSLASSSSVSHIHYDPVIKYADAAAALSRSSAEARVYCWFANVVAETCWIWNLLCELHTPLSSTTIVYCDNVSAVYLVFYSSFNIRRTKHIEIGYFICVRDLSLLGSTYQYNDEKTMMWDVGGDDFGTLEDTSFLEFESLT